MNVQSILLNLPKLTHVGIDGIFSDIGMEAKGADISKIFKLSHRLFLTFALLVALYFSIHSLQLISISSLAFFYK